MQVVSEVGTPRWRGSKDKLSCSEHSRVTKGQSVVGFIGDPLCIEFLGLAAVWAMHLIVLSSTVPGVIGIIKPPEEKKNPALVIEFQILLE